MFPEPSVWSVQPHLAFVNLEPLVKTSNAMDVYMYSFNKCLFLAYYVSGSSPS